MKTEGIIENARGREAKAGGIVGNERDTEEFRFKICILF